MKFLRKSVLLLVSGLALTMVLGGEIVPAAAAGASTYVVDDMTGNNNGTKCPIAGYTTVDDAIAAINAAVSRNNIKLTICPGTYVLAGPQVLDGFTTLSITGVGGPVISVPGGFTGIALDIQNSNKVTVTGLGLKGYGNLGGAFSEAIRFYNTNGTISKNIVSGWHQMYNGTPPFVETGEYHGIAVFAISGPQAVNIQQNSVYDSGDFGIWVYDPGKVNITKNRVIFTASIIPSHIFTGGFRFQAGIGLLWSGAGSKITDNQIETTADLYPGGILTTFTVGIMIYATSGTQIKSNTVQGAEYAITVLSYCDTISIPNANNNQIISNKLYDSSTSAIAVISSEVGVGCSVPHADNTLIQSNKIYTSRLGIPQAIYLNQVSFGTVEGTIIKGNTIGGYNPATALETSASTGTVISSNKILPLPPAGSMP